MEHFQYLIVDLNITHYIYSINEKVQSSYNAYNLKETIQPIPRQ
jgi:hypothetical protein